MGAVRFRCGYEGQAPMTALVSQYGENEIRAYSLPVMGEHRENVAGYLQNRKRIMTMNFIC